MKISWSNKWLTPHYKPISYHSLLRVPENDRRRRWIAFVASRTCRRDGVATLSTMTDCRKMTNVSFGHSATRPLGHFRHFCTYSAIALSAYQGYPLPLMGSQWPQPLSHIATYFWSSHQSSCGCRGKLWGCTRAIRPSET